ncbi:MAG TPA: hypothetical protein VFI27_03915, partial [candidate division Zixibacteria bacterium]|nr:hypothetical protein [candidate division Zixibacteria bacterium]
VSADEDFPVEAIEEVRKERGEPNFELPPSHVDVILGLTYEQHLYVVLNSQVQLLLPYSCNAPFIQTPDREGIKHPATSPTNRWLLDRLGRLASSTMAQWLGNHTLDMSERSKAYDLISGDQYIGGSSLSNDCSRIIQHAFREDVENRSILLTHNGQLMKQDQCLDFPSELFDVWSVESLLDLFSKQKRYLIAPEVSKKARKGLEALNLLVLTESKDITERLKREPYPPCPNDWKRILSLWAFIEQLTARSREWRWTPPRDLAIVPVKDHARLFPAELTVSMSTKDRQPEDSEWAFLSKYVRIVDPHWIQLVSKAGKSEDQPTQDSLQMLIRSAAKLFDLLKLGTRVGVDTIIKHAADEVFKKVDPGHDGVVLAHLAARLGANVTPTFRYRCMDGQWRPVSDSLLSAPGPEIEMLLPNSFLLQHSIHSDYGSERFRNNWSYWHLWKKTPNSGLREFILPQLVNKPWVTLSETEKLIIQRGGHLPTEYQLKSHNFTLEDFDYKDELWAHWELMEKDHPEIWAKLVMHVARDWKNGWINTAEAEVRQRGTTLEHPLDHGELAAAWIHRLRNMPCLPDVYGQLHLPSNLLRHTAETAPLERIEDFVHPDYDQPQHRYLLDLLGVSSSPANADGLVERIRSLAQASEPPLHALLNLYEGLDRILPRLGTIE